MVTAAYGKIIPENIFNTPSFKTINIHPSLLPKLRGASPIQSALLEDLNETGISLIVIDKEIDHGPIISQEKIKIKPNDTYDTLEPKLADLGVKMLIRDLSLYASNKLKPLPQDHSQATFTRKIEKQDGKINWDKPAQEIYNQWRAFIRWPGVFTFIPKKDSQVRLNLVKISIASIPAQLNMNEPGIIFSSGNQVFVKCGNGLIEVHQTQPEGKQIMSAREFINGYQNLLGQKLVF